MNEIIIYGASESGEIVYNELNNEFQILYFVDGNKTLHNKKIYGKEIKSPDTLKEDINMCFIVASSAWKEIAKNLRQIGASKILIFEKSSYEKAKKKGKNRNYFEYLLPYTICQKLYINCDEEKKYFVDKINTYINELKYNKASLETLFALSCYSMDLNFHLLKATILRKQGYIEEAEVIIDKILEIYPECEQALNEKKHLLLNLNDDKKYLSIQIKQRLLFDKKEELIKKSTCNNFIKVLQAGVDTGQMSDYSRALEKYGFFSKCIPFNENPFIHYRDYFWPTSYFNRYDIISNLLEEYDLFHFHFGISFLKNFEDIKIIKEMGKKCVFSFWGSDCRLSSKARTLGKYYIEESCDENITKKKLEKIGSMVDDCCVMDEELYLYVKDFFKNVHITRTILDTEKYSEINSQNSIPVIVHAPTSRYYKGTSYILPVIEKLKSKYKFEFKLIENQTRENAQKEIEKSDIIVNSMLGPAYGVLCNEGMAMGKVVVTNISEKLDLPEDLPIVSADPDTLYSVLENLIIDENKRSQIAKKGRPYIEKYHSPESCVRNMISIYQNIMNR